MLSMNNMHAPVVSHAQFGKAEYIDGGSVF
jgi:hypothetical protein